MVLIATENLDQQIKRAGGTDEIANFLKHAYFLGRFFCLSWIEDYADDGRRIKSQTVGVCNPNDAQSAIRNELVDPITDRGF